MKTAKVSIEKELDQNTVATVAQRFYLATVECFKKIDTHKGGGGLGGFGVVNEESAFFSVCQTFKLIFFYFEPSGI